MKAQNIFQIVIVRGNEIVMKYDEFCLTTDSLYNRINALVADYESDGYTIENYKFHKWAERADKYGHWETVTHVKTMTHVSEWRTDKKIVGFITYKAS